MGTSNTRTIMIRHDTPYPAYRRAGLVLERDSKPFDVTEAQLEILKNDKWVVIHEISRPKAK